ncbi:hypothetical protein BDV06DRAFT_223272 [Aspergillus oleicola]
MPSLFGNTPFASLLDLAFKRGDLLPNHSPSGPENAEDGTLSTEIPTLVDWGGPEDPENPQNWSTGRKTFVLFQICILTVAIYAGSAIITPAEPVFVEIYNISVQVSTLVLSMYVMGYSMYELLNTNGCTFILLFFCLPETLPETILLRRAERLRRTTANSRLRSQSEIKQHKVSLPGLLGRLLTTPFRVTVMDPSVSFMNVYTALAYGIYQLISFSASNLTIPPQYSYFESVALVYIDIYGFSTGLMGVIFLSIIIASIIGGLIYILLALSPPSYLLLNPASTFLDLGTLSSHHSDKMAIATKSQLSYAEAEI